MNPKSPAVIFGLTLLGLAALAYAQLAEARVTCTPSAPTFSTAYGSALNITAGSFTVTCSESRAGRTATATYQVSASLGGNSVGTVRYAKTTGAAPNTLQYDLTSDSGCTTTWNTTALLPATTYTTPAFTSAAPDVHTFYFWGCVPAGLTVPKNGNYTDSVTLAFVNTSITGDRFSRFRTSTLSISITAPATCAFSTAPSNMTFNYTSGQGTAATATGSYALTCNNLLPYTMSLDSGGATYTGSWTSPTGTYANTASGLNYTLALSPATSTGTGVAQTFAINGSMPAGQGGTCATVGGCTFSDVHTLTVTY